MVRKKNKRKSSKLINQVIKKKTKATVETNECHGISCF